MPKRPVIPRHKFVVMSLAGTAKKGVLNIDEIAKVINEHKGPNEVVTYYNEKGGIERIYFPVTDTVIDLTPVIAKQKNASGAAGTDGASKESKAHFNIEKEFSPDSLERSGTQVQKSERLHFRRRNEWNLPNVPITDDQLLAALKERGISSTLVQRVARELVGNSDNQLPLMNEEDLRQLAQQTKANPWSSELARSPSEFVSAIYEKWLGKKRLMREQISAAGAPMLMAAYSTEINRHPERRLEHLGERPHTRHGSLPKHLPKAPSNTWVPTAELSEEQRIARRRIEAKKKRDQRAKKQPKTMKRPSKRRLTRFDR